jgi:hypothetical protein
MIQRGPDAACLKANDPLQPPEIDRYFLHKDDLQLSLRLEVTHKVLKRFLVLLEILPAISVFDDQFFGENAMLYSVLGHDQLTCNAPHLLFLYSW